MVAARVLGFAGERVLVSLFACGWRAVAGSEGDGFAFGRRLGVGGGRFFAAPAGEEEANLAVVLVLEGRHFAHAERAAGRQGCVAARLGEALSASRDVVAAGP